MERDLQRRHFLKLLGASSSALIGCAPAVVVKPALVSPPPPTPAPANETSAAAPPIEAPLTLNASEYAFVEAAVDVLIPEDALSPSASACGVAVFIDRQLAGAYGSGARSYRGGPFVAGKPEHGYQLALTPRELFRSSIALINELSVARHKLPFDALGEDLRAELLTQLERGQTELAAGQVFFELLLSLTMEGFFADPIYGGNRDMAGWKMVGFPGLPATYREAIVQYHDTPYPHAPQSIADFA
jgi:gluconate 2-dehydrogenase gamma chain